jgi:TatD DNase family protein
MWVDAHLHLDDTAFDLDRDAVIVRAVDAGVRWMVSAGTSLAGSRRVLELAGRYRQVAAAVGIHPAPWAKLDRDLEVDAHVVITDRDFFDHEAQHLLLLLKGKVV